MTPAGAPRGRRLRVLADGLAVLSATLLVAAVVMLVRGGSSAPNRSTGTLLLELVASGGVPFVVGFGGVGWLLARRLPHNAVGWCFSLGGLTWAAGTLDAVWRETVLASGTDPSVWVRLSATLAVFGWIYSMPFSVQLPLLLLPDGRLLSPRWRWAVWTVAAGVVIGTAGFATLPGVIEGTDPERNLVNPLGVRFLGPLPQILAYTGAGLLLVAMVAGAVAVVVRFRRARGVERQQMRWVALGGCCVLLGPLTALVPGVPEWSGQIGGTVSIVAVPVCVGVAVLRYRLYDLGRVVSRTVSYAVITAVLLGVYFALVTTSARLLPDGSSLAVAASTLAAAALFQPLRRRVQTAVDHRFNRARYDADRTVDAFTRRLRDEVDLDTVRTDLLTVVHDTLQPATTGLWLRHGAR
jgi:hypothetical protein